MWPSWWGYFWPKGQNLNTLGRGLLEDAPTKYQGSWPCDFRQEDVFMIPYISPCKTCDPWGEPFWPHGYNLDKLGTCLLYYSAHQILRFLPFWFQTRFFSSFLIYRSKKEGKIRNRYNQAPHLCDFFMFCLYRPLLNMWPPPPRAGHF